MILSDSSIKNYASKYDMINPFVDYHPKINGVVSWGLTSAGYDLRADKKIKVFNNIKNTVIDPKNFDKDLLVDFEDDFFDIPPQSYILAKSMEYLKIPKNIIGICMGKSTYARNGIIVNTTPLEPGWQGYLVVEISNSLNSYNRIYLGEGIAQVVFHTIDQQPERTYSDRGGKYQHQKNIITAYV